MFRIKRIDRYIFSEFFRVLIATFFICIFVFSMQFVWQRINDLVGKGLEIDILAEFFWYTILSIIPLALPLSILLASLMTFGELGENIELSAMKAAGISLFRIMRSLLVFIILVCVGAFYFSNDILPKSQTRLWTLVLSMRQTSPEIEIPVNEFYSGIRGFNIYVREKDQKRKLLKDLMIYDFSNGFNNASVTVADSGRIQVSEDKYYLILTLYDGEAFENVKKENVFSATTKSVPYRRETFKKKVVLIEFDTNFNMQDESVFDDTYISKNFAKLVSAIDSSQILVDSIIYEFQEKTLSYRYNSAKDSIPKSVNLKQYDADTLFFSFNRQKMINAVSYAISRAEDIKNDVSYHNMYVENEEYSIRRYAIALHKKFTLSFACLVFFFIGAPLGAIIRKGGLGMPLVISVLFFIVYYIIDNFGFKLAREGVWEIWTGVWLSSFIIFPIGVFLTYKAATDSAIFVKDVYLKIFNNLNDTSKDLFFRALDKISDKLNI